MWSLAAYLAIAFFLICAGIFVRSDRFVAPMLGGRSRIRISAWQGRTWFIGSGVLMAWCGILALLPKFGIAPDPRWSRWQGRFEHLFDSSFEFLCGLVATTVGFLFALRQSAPWRERAIWAAVGFAGAMFIWGAVLEFHLIR